MGQEKYWLQERGPLLLWRWRIGVLQGPAQVIVANQQVSTALLRYLVHAGHALLCSALDTEEKPLV